MSFMSEDPFCKDLFTIQFILENKNNAITLVDICTIRYDFIDEKFAENVYQTLEMKLQCRRKPKLI